MIEIIAARPSGAAIRHALFDFDGTLSLIREGWQDVMTPLMVEWLQQTPRHESAAELERYARDYVGQSTGIQTIYQMMHVAEAVRRRGGEPLDPFVYKRIYVDRLWQRVKQRVADLKQGKLPADDLMVPGARVMLTELNRRGVACYLASGTDEPYVVDESAALGLARFFAGIYGARDNDIGFSKKLLIERIIRENRLAGPELVVFGDGFVEIEDGKRAGATTVGVASDEVARSGVNEWKRTRLIQAGADVIVPDFSEQGELIGYLFTGATHDDG